MKDIELLINKDTGYIENTSSFLIQQENLQRKIIFKFKEGFVDGNAYLCIEKDNAQGKIKLTKNEEQYETTIKSNMVSNTKSIKISLRILQAPVMEYNEEEETEEEQTPIFVSKVSILNVAETIIAEDELPEDLPTWQDTVNEELSELETSVENLSNTKQDNLISGETIKTINNQSILGEGNISITVESIDYSNVNNKPQINNVTLSGNKSLNDLGIQPAGNYALSSDIPTVPTNISAFTNDVGYITSYTETDPIFTNSPAYGITNNDISNWNNKSNFSGNYNDLTNKPTIPTVPTNISAFTNDSGYITNNVNDLSNYYTKTEINALLTSLVPKTAFSYDDNTDILSINIDNEEE